MNLNRFDLNLLRSLDALLAEKNVTRAATQLFVTQQAASGALRRLREHFSDELLTKVGRHLELTPLARSLINPVREALLAAQAALDARPTFDPATSPKTYRIAMSDYGLLVMLPRLLRRLAFVAPHLSYVIEPVTEESFERLEMGDLDVCMTAHDPRLYGMHRMSAHIRSDPLFHEEFVCVLDRDSSGVTGRLSLKQYVTLRHSSVAIGPGVLTLVEKAWAASGHQFDVAVTAPTFSALLIMLPGTPYVATAQRRLAQLLAPTLKLAMLKCPLPIPTLQENLMWHERNEPDPGHRYMREVMHAAAAALDLEAPASYKQRL